MENKIKKTTGYIILGIVCAIVVFVGGFAAITDPGGVMHFVGKLLVCIIIFVILIWFVIFAINLINPREFKE